MALNYAERKAKERKEARRAAGGAKTLSGIRKREKANADRKKKREADSASGNSVFDRFKKAFSASSKDSRAAKKKREADTAKKYMEKKKPASSKKRTRQEIAMAESIARSKKSKGNFEPQDKEVVGKGVNLRKEAENAARMDNRQDVKSETMEQKSKQTGTATNVPKPPPKVKTNQDLPNKPTWKDYKTPAAAKKAGFKSYMGKDGEEKAAVFREELGKGTTDANAKSRLTKLLNKRNKAAKNIPAIANPAIKKPVIGEEEDKKVTMKKGGGVKKMNMGGMAAPNAAGMDSAAMMAMKKKKRKPMMPAQQAMAGGASVPMMKKGGKVRGYGIARGGKACKMR
jgi:hypothetical protein